MHRYDPPNEYKTTTRETDLDQLTTQTTMILGAARDVFESLGYHDASVELIARCAHTTVASIYEHFPSQIAILEALGTKIEDEYTDKHIDSLYEYASELDATEVLTAIVKSCFDIAVTNSAFFQMLNNASPYNSAVRRIRDELRSASVNLFDSYLKRARLHRLIDPLTGTYDVACSHVQLFEQYSISVTDRHITWLEATDTIIDSLFSIGID